MGKNLISLARAHDRFAQRAVPVNGQELVAANVELVTRLEGLCLDAFLWLDGEVDLVQWAANLVNLANWRLRLGQLAFPYCKTGGVCAHLVLEVDWRVEVRDLDVYRLAEKLALDVVHEFAHLW